MEENEKRQPAPAKTLTALRMVEAMAKDQMSYDMYYPWKSISTSHEADYVHEKLTGLLIAGGITFDDNCHQAAIMSPVYMFRQITRTLIYINKINEEHEFEFSYHLNHITEFCDWIGNNLPVIEINDNMEKVIMRDHYATNGSKLWDLTNAISQIGRLLYYAEGGDATLYPVVDVEDKKV
jgi:hypothetical protein